MAPIGTPAALAGAPRVLIERPSTQNRQGARAFLFALTARNARMAWSEHHRSPPIGNAKIFAMEVCMKNRGGAVFFSMLAFMALAVEHAQAQANQTFVSGVGDDTGACTRASPCKTFFAANTKTAINGEINCLDSGNFGPLSLDKSLTIDCHEALSSNVAPSGSPFVIAFDNFSGGDTRKTVRLRNLNLNGITAGVSGLIITANGGGSAGSTVIIEDCVIDGFNSGNARGIDDTRTNGGRLIVTNTTIRNNGGAGVSVLPSSGSANIQVLLNNVRSYRNGTGAQFGNLTRVMIDQSTFDGNTGAGILTVAGAIVQVDRSTITHNANGVQAAGGTVALSNSNISFNTSQGINNSGGSVLSFGNNRIAFNASAGTAPGPAGSASSDLGQQ
jgi:hypothetical protein